MRVAVLADIHGNLPACEAVLEDIKRHSPDYIVAAGDLALRGAYPAETVDLLTESCDALLMGNTDCYVAGNYLGGAYREADHWKAELLAWTRDQLGSERVKKLGQLPFSVRYSPRRGQDLFVCHANPRNLEEALEPTLDDHTLRKFLQNLDAAAVAFGHLHFPYRRRVGRTVIADVASAGIPRDGDLRPAWGLFTFTPRGWRVQIRRVRYAIRKSTQSLSDRKVPGASLLIHKMLEARYRHHSALAEAARRHSGLPPGLRPPGASPARPPPPSNRPASLPPPPALDMPPPGQSTMVDEAADELLISRSLVEASPTLDVPPSGEHPTGDDQDNGFDAEPFSDDTPVHEPEREPSEGEEKPISSDSEH